MQPAQQQGRFLVRRARAAGIAPKGGTLLSRRKIPTPGDRMDAAAGIEVPKVGDSKGGAGQSDKGDLSPNLGRRSVLEPW
jgi:hypothetical protein